MLRSIFAVVAVFLVSVPVVQAAPLSVRIDDHDFTFDVPNAAEYHFNGAAPDTLTVAWEDNRHFVHGYTYLGSMPTIPGAPAASPDPYPLVSGTPEMFGANLKLDMQFDVNDGPYTNPAMDTFDISLVGEAGRLTVVGKVATQVWPFAPLYPTPWVDVTLLDIIFDDVTLLSRAGVDVADLVEGRGQVVTLMGEDISAQGVMGSVFFKFMADPGTVIFPNLAGAVYSPMVDFSLADITEARISGEAGVLPEPATLALLALGGLGMAAARRRRI